MKQITINIKNEDTNELTSIDVYRIGTPMCDEVLKIFSTIRIAEDDNSTHIVVINNRKVGVITLPDNPSISGFLWNFGKSIHIEDEMSHIRKMAPSEALDYMVKVMENKDNEVAYSMNAHFVFVDGTYHSFRTKPIESEWATKILEKNEVIKSDKATHITSINGGEAVFSHRVINDSSPYIFMMSMGKTIKDLYNKIKEDMDNAK